MKLYATTTSERASKGQGGNDYLDIAITVSNERVSAGRVIVEPSKSGYRIYYIPPTGNTTTKGVTLSEITREYIEYKTKGEKQKGDYHKCKKHEERTRECKFYSFRNDPCSEI